MEKVTDYPYPLNLYRDLCGRMGKPLPDKITDDQLKGLNILTDAISNEKYRVILLERFLFCKSLSDIAAAYGFTKSRAGQIVDVTLKKLCGNPLSGMLMGYDEFIATSTIDVLSLSTRAKNAFMRNDINTLEDIKYYGLKNIVSLRAIGQDTLDEIIEKTWFLWTREELDENKSGEILTPRQVQNLRIALRKKGMDSRTIGRIIKFVETNEPDEK